MNFGEPSTYPVILLSDVVADSLVGVLRRNSTDSTVEAEMTLRTSTDYEQHYTAAFTVPLAWADGQVSLRVFGAIAGQEFERVYPLSLTGTAEPGTADPGTAEPEAPQTPSRAMFASPEQLLLRTTAQTLAEVVSPDSRLVSGTLLATALSGQDLSGYSAAENAAATEAMARLQQVLADASAEVEGYLAGRYSQLASIPHLLSVHTVDIALYRLLKGDKDSVEARHYDTAIRYLTKVAAGTIVLAIADDDQANSTGAGSVIISNTEAVFNASMVGF